MKNTFIHTGVFLAFCFSLPATAGIFDSATSGLQTVNGTSEMCPSLEKRVVEDFPGAGKSASARNFKARLATDDHIIKGFEMELTGLRAQVGLDHGSAERLQKITLDETALQAKKASLCKTYREGIVKQKEYARQLQYYSCDEEQMDEIMNNVLKPYKATCAEKKN